MRPTQLNTTRTISHPKPSSSDVKKEPTTIKGAVKDGQTHTAKTTPRK